MNHLGYREKKKQKTGYASSQGNETKEERDLRLDIERKKREFFQKYTQRKRMIDNDRIIDEKLRKAEAKYKTFRDRRKQAVLDEKEAKDKKDVLEARIADLNKKIDEENKQHEKKIKRIEKDLKTAKKKSGPRGGLGQPLFLKERLRPCGEILNVIMQHEHAEIFKREVDRKIYPHYYTKIKNPMWLNKVKSNLYAGYYKTEIEFQREMSQVWINAKEFNPETNAVHVWATLLEKLFNSEIDKRYSRRMLQPINEIIPSPVEMEMEEDDPNEVVPLTMEQLSLIEKYWDQLPDEIADDATDLIAGDDGGDQLECNLEELDPVKGRKLYQLLDSHFHFDQLVQNKNKDKVENEIDLKSDSEDSDMGDKPMPSNPFVDFTNTTSGQAQSESNISENPFMNTMPSTSENLNLMSNIEHNNNNPSHNINATINNNINSINTDIINTTINSSSMNDLLNVNSSLNLPTTPMPNIVASPKLSLQEESNPFCLNSNDHVSLNDALLTRPPDQNSINNSLLSPLLSPSLSDLQTTNSIITTPSSINLSQFLSTSTINNLEQNSLSAIENNSTLMENSNNENIQTEIGVVTSPLISMNVPKNIPNTTNPLDAFVSDSNIMANAAESNMDLSMQNVEPVEINKPETPELPSKPTSNKSLWEVPSMTKDSQEIKSERESYFNTIKTTKPPQQQVEEANVNNMLLNMYEPAEQNEIMKHPPQTVPLSPKNPEPTTPKIEPVVNQNEQRDLLDTLDEFL